MKATVVAQRWSKCHVISISWVWILPDAGLFSSSIFSYHQWSVLNQVAQTGASLIVCCESKKKWMPSCAAWGKTGSISSDWVKKHQRKNIQHLTDVKAADDPLVHLGSEKFLLQLSSSTVEAKLILGTNSIKSITIVKFCRKVTYWIGSSIETPLSNSKLDVLKIIIAMFSFSLGIRNNHKYLPRELYSDLSWAKMTTEVPN